VCPVRAGRGSDARPVCTGRSGDVRPVCTGIVSCSNVTKRFRMLSGLSSARPEVLPRSSSRACITGSEHSKKSTKQTSTSSLSTAVQPWKMITWLIQEYPTIQLFPPRDAGARTMEATVRSRGSGPFREATRPFREVHLEIVDVARETVDEEQRRRRVAPGRRRVRLQSRPGPSSSPAGSAQAVEGPALGAGNLLQPANTLGPLRLRKTPSSRFRCRVSSRVEGRGVSD
jgi:hypothetical protein